MASLRADLADLRFMDAALAAGFAALGTTAPNPAVGCVIVKEGRVLAVASTAPGGRPHAETVALAQAGVLLARVTQTKEKGSVQSSAPERSSSVSSLQK